MAGFPDAWLERVFSLNGAISGISAILAGLCAQLLTVREGSERMGWLGWAGLGWAAASVPSVFHSARSSTLASDLSSRVSLLPLCSLSARSAPSFARRSTWAWATLAPSKARSCSPRSRSHRSCPGQRTTETPRYDRRHGCLRGRAPFAVVRARARTHAHTRTSRALHSRLQSHRISPCVLNCMIPSNCIASRALRWSGGSCVASLRRRWARRPDWRCARWLRSRRSCYSGSCRASSKVGRPHGWSAWRRPDPASPSTPYPRPQPDVDVDPAPPGDAYAPTLPASIPSAPTLRASDPSAARVPRTHALSPSPSSSPVRPLRRDVHVRLQLGARPRGPRAAFGAALPARPCLCLLHALHRERLRG
jgi:hypothetical protein